MRTAREERFRKTRLDLSYRLDYPLVRPSKVIFLVTHRCPLKCVMCWTRGADQTSELPAVEVLSMIDQASAWGVPEVMFSGGEPFLRLDDVAVFVRRSSELGLLSSVITSGWLMTPEKMERLYDAGLNVLMFSIDGPDAATHDAIRGVPGSFDRIVGAIRMASGFRGMPRPHVPDEALAEKFVIGTMSVVMDQNAHLLPRIHDLLSGLGADFMDFQAVTADPGNAAQWVKKENLAALKTGLEEIVRRNANERRVMHSDEYLRAIVRYFEDPGARLRTRCMAGFGEMIVTAQGEVSTCFGNVPQAGGGTPDLRRLWRAPAFRPVRRKIRSCTRPCIIACWSGQ
ncbi:MAG: radical SAM protein [Deltaproteobacteria bacterium]|nr:radical SAM protein [Deltaproteobacteria bacterium]